MNAQPIAQGLAALGRGQDKMLVHMTPGEVRGLQALAVKHGGSLTINPRTGLPEAGFLSSLLPTLAGVGLSFIPGVGPMMAAGIVGGLSALKTGSLKSGLLAGLGAYGGAGLGNALAGMGTTAAEQAAQSVAASEAATSAAAAQAPGSALGSAVDMGSAGIGQAAGSALGEPFAYNAASVSGASTPFASMPVGDQMSTMWDGAKYGVQNPSALLTADNLKYGLAAAAPSIAHMSEEEARKARESMPGSQQPSEYYATSFAPGARNTGFGAPGQSYFSGRGFGGGNKTTVFPYAEGGVARLLNGPGDGVSDSIPAMIEGHNPQPAALSDGEFVIPARIVSEIGNGSTKAGAQKLYAMMDRIQQARRKTVTNVAADTKAERLLPA